MTWRFALRHDEPPLLGIAFWREDETGLCLAAGGADGSARLFCATGATSAANGELQPDSAGALSPRVLLNTSNKTRDAQCMAFAPASGHIAAGYGDGTMRLRTVPPNTINRRKLRALESGAAPVNALAFSPDETLLAVGLGDGTVALWSIAGGKRRTMSVEEHCGVTALAFSPDGASLAVGGDNGAVGVWEVAGGINGWTQTRHEFWIRALAFSPNSRALASGGYGGAVRVWAAQSGVELQTLAGHDESVSALAFASDSRTLLSGGLDEAVRVWDSWTGALQHNTAARGVVTAIALRSGRAEGVTIHDALAIATTRDIIVWQGSGTLDWDALEFPDSFVAPA